VTLRHINAFHLDFPTDPMNFTAELTRHVIRTVFPKGKLTLLGDRQLSPMPPMAKQGTENQSLELTWNQYNTEPVVPFV
jgi:hypothetical protein